MGSLTVVQPLIATELVIVFAVIAVHDPHRVHGRDWLSALGMVIGLGAFLALARPSGGHSHSSMSMWVLAGALDVRPGRRFLSALAYLPVPAGPPPERGPQGRPTRCGRRDGLRLRGRRHQGAQHASLARTDGRVLELVPLCAASLGCRGHVPGLERLPGRFPGRLAAGPDHRRPAGCQRTRGGALRRTAEPCPGWPSSAKFWPWPCW